MERLKPRVVGKPLERGKWVHALLEAYYKGEDWKALHRRLSSKFIELFDEEKEELGDLPKECARLMQSYLWHYGATGDDMHGWEIIAVEAVVEAILPDGTIYRGKVDMVVRDRYGVWIVDHKTHKSLPDLAFRLLDAQSALYLWALLHGTLVLNNGERVEIAIDGFMWNYIKTAPPAEPKLAYAGTKRERLSKVLGDTDYPTLYRGLKRLGLDVNDYKQQLLVLKRDRWAPDKPQTSPFFRRETLEKGSPMLARVADEAFHTHERMRAYDFTRSERVVDRSCRYMCSYNRLCQTELYGGNADQVRRSGFKVGNPHDYAYDDDKSREDRA